ncbi:MAG TPA: flagellar hook-basal body complex protein [Planctomycetaceae bacterium]|nr:flagellar hook-basal body complex protein [Planctomycetaceae bacterium]
MGLTSALNTSVNGLSLNETAIAVIGNNIANADTNGFKASDVLFTTQLAQTLSVGSGPTATNGGTNPQQIGLGASIATIATDFSQGSITNTSSPSDLAIQGQGFFVLNSPSGDVYTRDGSFTLSANNQLVNPEGFAVQGFGVDSNFNLVTSHLQSLTIPIGDLNVAQQTSQISLNGALLPTGQVATQGAHILSDTLGDAGNGGADATGTTLLTNLEDPPGTSLGIKVGDVLSFTPEVGGTTLPATNLTVTATTTLGDLANFMDGALGIQSGNGIPNDPNKVGGPGQPGVDIVNGQLEITGNMGTANDITVAVGDLTDNGTSLPINFDKNETANGESATTNFVVYDSLGTPLTVTMTAVLQSTAPGATTYRYFFNSEDNDAPSTALGTGTLVFNSSGVVSSGGTGSFSINRSATAAVSPMVVSVNLSNISGISSAAAGSTLSLASQNGSAPGTLTSFVIDQNGVINGVFDNGDTRTLGQVMLATFANQQGLVQAGNGTFTDGVGAGPANLVKPNTFGAGSLQSGAVELSNTDIGSSLVSLITISTNYQGNARVISVVDQLVNDLLTLAQQTT